VEKKAQDGTTYWRSWVTVVNMFRDVSQFSWSVGLTHKFCLGIDDFNKVTLRRARLVLRWVTVWRSWYQGWKSGGRLHGIRLAKIWTMTIPSIRKAKGSLWERTVLYLAWSLNWTQNYIQRRRRGERNEMEVKWWRTERRGRGKDREV